MKRQRGIIAIIGLALVSVASSVWFAPIHATEVSRVPLPLLGQATTGQSSAGVGYIPQCRESAIYVIWSVGTSAGVVQIESSYDANYTGTWAPLQTVTWSAASRQDIVQITGVHMNLRTRISTTIVGGTVSTGIVCN